MWILHLCLYSRILIPAPLVGPVLLSSTYLGWTMPSAPQPRRADGAADKQLLTDLLTAEVAGDDVLLGALLDSEVPSRVATLAPARLRSTAEQRTIALKPFRLRTWVDTALHRVEQGLVIAAVAAFGYWFYDGPLYDWMYAPRGAAQAAVAPSPTPSLQLPDTAPPAVAARLPALPFTTPNMSADAAPPSAAAPASPDFLQPQAIPARPQADDPRPRRLLLPSIGVDTGVAEVFVVDGAWQVADYAAGYHNGSALPGSVGNMVMAGHAGLRGAVFRDLGNMKVGDEAVVESAGWRYVYRVREVKSVWPTQVEVMEPTPTAVLTLITCTNWDTQRLIVVADLIDARPLS